MQNTDKFTNTSLSEQIDLLEILFERMPMGIAVLDRDFCFQRYNPTWAGFANRYAPPGSKPIGIGVYYFDHIPGSEEIVLPLFERVLEGETIRQDGLLLEAGGITSYWDITLAPLTKDGEIIGILNVSVDATERVEMQQNLEQRVLERTEELNRRREIAESLRDIIGVLNSSQSLTDTLTFITKEACQILKSEACLIHHIQKEDDFVAIQASYGLPEKLQEFSGFPLYSSARADSSIINREPVWIDDFTKKPPPSAEALEKIPPEVLEWRNLTNQYYRAWLAVPLVVKEEVYGSVAFYYAAPKIFNDEVIWLSQSFADQAALAIENANLYQEIEQTSRTAERNRLARDLHDAVTQTLFSSTMIADVLPKIWARDPEAGKQRLEELRQLTRGALSEMRTLLVELRPTALADADLEDLIGHQVNAFVGRTGLTVNFEPECQHNPPVTIKEMFYRITQEALNNISKHAEASTVTIELNCQPEKTALVIQDDGIGFDLQAAGVEGLGLGIMQERATSLGGKLEINSQIGKGTQLRVFWPEA